MKDLDNKIESLRNKIVSVHNFNLLRGHWVTRKERFSMVVVLETPR